MQHQALTSGAFARLCGTSKATLRHYREIGLLVPRTVGENGYRYYDSTQFYDYRLIHILKATGTPLAEIQAYLCAPAPDEALSLLARQRARLAETQRALARMERSVAQAIADISLGLSAQFPTGEPIVTDWAAEHLIALPIPSDGDEGTFIDLLRQTDAICQAAGAATNYQTGAILSATDLLRGRQTVSHLYTRIDRPADSPHYREKPAGRYLALVTRGGWDTADGFHMLAQAIRARGLTLCGSVYAYDLAGYLLNGVSAHTMSLLAVQIAAPTPDNRKDDTT